MTVWVNGQHLASPTARVVRQLLPSGARVSLRRGGGGGSRRTAAALGEGNEDRLVLVTPDLSAAVRMPGRQFKHLDLLLLAVSPYLCNVHGVLGQTYKLMFASDADRAGGGAAEEQRGGVMASGMLLLPQQPGDAGPAAAVAFELEGAEWDYEISNVLSDDFLFNRFNAGSGGGCGSVPAMGGGLPAVLDAVSGRTAVPRSSIGVPLLLGDGQQGTLPLPSH